MNAYKLLYIHFLTKLNMKRKSSTYIQPLCEVYQLLNEVDLLVQSPNRNKPQTNPPTLRIDNSKEITKEDEIF